MSHPGADYVGPEPILAPIFWQQIFVQCDPAWIALLQVHSFIAAASNLQAEVQQLVHC